MNSEWGMMNSYMRSLTKLLHIQLLPNVTLCNKVSESELLDHSMGNLKVAKRTLVEFEELSKVSHPIQ